MNKYILIILPLFCWSCQQNGQDLSNGESKKLKLDRVSDTMVFTDKVKRYPMWFEHETNRLIFRNKTDSLLEYFDAETHQLVKVARIDAKFWEFVNSPTDDLVMFSGEDLIFLYDTLYNLSGLLTIWDLEKGAVKKQFPITYNDETDHVFIKFKRQFMPYFDFENQRIFTRGFNYENYEQRRYVFDTEILAEYDMNTGQKKMISFKFPEIMERLNTCSLQSEVYACWRGDSVIISYATAPNIDVYSVHDSLLTRYVVPHAHYDSLAGNNPDVAKNADLCKQGKLTCFFFGPVKYNPSQDLFYRTYRDKMDLMKPDSTYNTEFDKPFGLQVLDPNLKILGDFPIGNLYPWEELFEMYPTKTGLLYVSTVSPTDTICLNYLNFKYE